MKPVRSLRFRVTSWYVGLLAAALLLFGGAVYFGLQAYLEASLEHSLHGEAATIAQQFVANVEKMGPAWLGGEVREAYAPENTGRFIRISRDDGTVLYVSNDARDSNIQSSRIRRAPLSGGARKESLGGSGSVEVYALPYVASSGRHYLVETGTSLNPMQRMLRTLLQTLLLLTPVILAIAAMGGYLLMSRPLRPVVELTQHTERIGTASMGERLPVIRTGDELERLTVALNRMINRLEGALAHNRRFSADVSHELRTPLTILRGELEPLLQLHALSADVREAVASSLEEIDRMSRIVESLLAISRLDSGGAAINKSAVDLLSATRSTAEQMHLLAEEKAVDVRCEGQRGVAVLADETRLKQVVVNLLANAIKYTPEGGRIKLTVQTVATSGVLEVTDNGIGIPADSLPYVFDRFYRADKARTRESGGAGLGLSIVKAICTAHEADVEIRSREGEGTRVRVVWPLARSREQMPVVIDPPRSFEGASVLPTGEEASESIAAATHSR